LLRIDGDTHVETLRVDPNVPLPAQSPPRRGFAIDARGIASYSARFPIDGKLSHRGAVNTDATIRASPDTREDAVPTNADTAFAYRGSGDGNAVNAYRDCGDRNAENA
jgi:hypothetical protein